MQARRGKRETMFSGHGDGDCAPTSLAPASRCTLLGNCKRRQDLIRPLHEEFPANRILQGSGFISLFGLRSISACFTSKRRLAPRRKFPRLVIIGKTAATLEHGGLSAEACFLLPSLMLPLLLLLLRVFSATCNPRRLFTLPPLRYPKRLPGSETLSVGWSEVSHDRVVLSVSGLVPFCSAF